MQARVREMVLVATLVGWLAVAPGALGQYYPPTYNPADPYSQYYSGQFYPPSPNPTASYSQFQQSYVPGQYYNYGQPYNYAQPPPGSPGTSAVYGYGGYPSNGPGSAYVGYGYNTPAYQGYGSPFAPPGYGYAYAPYSQYPGAGYYPGYLGGYPSYLSPPAAFTGAASGGGTFTVTATLAAPGSATITWNPVPMAISYAVYQGVNGTPPTLVTTTPSTTINLPLIGGSSVFQVHALGVNGVEVGVSNYSQPVQASAWGAQFPGGYPYNNYPYPGGAPYSGLPSQPSPATSTALVTPNPAPITTTAQLVVNVLDLNRAPVQGRNVVVTSSRGPSDVITPSSSPVTDVNGRVYFNVRGGSPGPASLIVTVDNIPLQPVVINFNPY